MTERPNELDEVRFNTPALIYRSAERSFQYIPSGEPCAAAEAYTDGLIVAKLPNGEYRPVWMLPSSLRPDLPQEYWQNWSARAARCRTTSELVSLLLEISLEQFEAIIETLPTGLVHDLTGQSWNRDKQALVFDHSLRRHEGEFAMRGIELEEIPARAGAPLSLDQLELVDGRPATAPGKMVPIEAMSLPPSLAVALHEQGGMKGLFSHQSLALEFIRRSGRDETNLILSTPTASGKTNAFLPGIIEQLLLKGGTAILIYPLKALSQDQEGKIRTLLAGPLGDQLTVASFVGTGMKPDDLYQRDGTLPNLLIATPDKLNHHLHAAAIQTVLGQARFLVLDEAHSYRSYFGSNVALFLRRLAFQTRSDCRFILSSATLENTIEFACSLTGRKRFRVVGRSGAPRHARYFYLASSGSGIPVRRHAPLIRSLAHDLRRGTDSAIVFVQRRTDTHSIESTVGKRGDGFVVPLYSGRKGYKQVIESLRRDTDTPRLIVSTTTLEAGVDIGNLAIAAMMGFPRNRNSFVQMAGRAGRSGPAHVAFLPGNGPADAYYGVFENFGRMVNESGAEPVYINPANHILLEKHLDRFRWEAMKSRGKQGITLLDALVPDDIDPQVREALIERLTPKLSAPLSSNKAPQLRGSMGVPYLVLRKGQSGDPVPLAGFSLKLESMEEVPEYLIERCNERNAYLEWAPDHVALREQRYYAVNDWTTGSLTQDGRTEPAVFIWADEVSDKFVSAEEANQIRLGLLDPPQDREEPERFNTSMMDIAPHLEHVIETRHADNLVVRAGTGEVIVTVSDTRRRFEPTVGYVCPKWARSRGKSLASLNPSASLLLQDRVAGTETVVAVRTFDRNSSFEHGRLHRGIGEGVVEASTARKIYRDGMMTRAEVEIHTFNGANEGHCSCGKRTTMKRDWDVSFEAVPPSWSEHEVFRKVVSRLETDLAHFVLTGDSFASLGAVAYAIAKALPDALKIDADDVGFSASFANSVLHLFCYDELEGGAAISLRIPEKLPEVLSAAQELLNQSVSCGCEGKGCYGCIRPFRDLQLYEPISADDEDPRRNPVELRAADGARFLQNLLSTDFTHLLEPSSTVAPILDTSDLADTDESPSRDSPTEPSGSRVGTEVQQNEPSLRLDAWVPPAWEPHTLPYFSHIVLDLESLRPQEASEILLATMRFQASPRHTLLTQDADTVQASLGGLPQEELTRALELVHEWRGVGSVHHVLTRSEGLPGPTLVLTSDPWKLTQIGQLGEGFYTALPLWVSDAATLLANGPLLIIEKPTYVPAALVHPNGFMHPLEQAGRKLDARHGPPLLSRAGLSIRALGRYDAEGSDGAGILDNSSQMLRAFQKHGQNAGMLAKYLSERHPGEPVAMVHRNPSEPVNGLTLLAWAMSRLGHPVVKVATLTTEGRKDSMEAGRQPILAITDLVNSGATLASACEALSGAGYEPFPLALAYQVDRAAQSELAL